MSTIELSTVIDGVPYYVKAEPFDFNTETRYKVQYGGKEYIFAFDATIRQYAALGDEASDIPDNLEIFVAEKLDSYNR